MDVAAPRMLLKVEELEEMVDLGHDNASSDGFSDASRELLARARGSFRSVRPIVRQRNGSSETVPFGSDSRKCTV